MVTLFLMMCLLVKAEEGPVPEDKIETSSARSVVKISDIDTIKISDIDTIKRDVTGPPQHKPYYDVTIRNYNRAATYRSGYGVDKKSTAVPASWYPTPQQYKYGLVYPPLFIINNNLLNTHLHQQQRVHGSPSLLQSPLPSPGYRLNYRSHHHPTAPYQILLTPTQHPTLNTKYNSLKINAAPTHFIQYKHKHIPATSHTHSTNHDGDQVRRYSTAVRKHNIFTAFVNHE